MTNKPRPSRGRKPAKTPRRRDTLRISVTRTAPRVRLDARRLNRALRLALREHDRRSCRLSVVLVDDRTMSGLHRRYLGLPGPTDVLSFDLGEGAGGDLEGEIIVSVDTAAREARRRGHAAADEVLLYALHGLLHLLGYDDHTASDARRMHAREDELLTQLGVGPVYQAGGSCGSR